MVEHLTETIRHFQPQIVVTHDTKGEYGHGFHILTCQAVMEAVDAAANQTLYEQSYTQYGVWDTPKTYIHLYPENKIRLNLRVPIEGMEGRTALEIAKEAYKKHVSQQGCWFYVSDEYKYSCADFGLWRTTVGTDENNDMLENIKTYKEQEEAQRLKEEEERRQEELKKQQERIAEEKRLAELEKQEELKKAEENKKQAEQETLRLEHQEQEQYRFYMAIMIGLVGVLVVLFFVRRCIVKQKK